MVLNITTLENPMEYLYDFCPNPNEVHNVDILSFRERTWCNEYGELPFKTKVCHDNVAVAEFESYADWLQHLKLETRARIKRAAKRGLTVKEVKYNESFAYGVWHIYNESKIRQGRTFSHYGVSLDDVMRRLFETQNVLLGAYHGNELVGFVELGLGDCTGQILQILSLNSKRDLLPNNALIAKAVEVCASHGLNWLVYARMGNHPSLDEFKRNNGFKRVEVKRFFVPLTFRGKLFLLLGLQRSFKDSIPQFLKPVGYHLYNFASRIHFN